jgi:AmmeMemoRadiSam system protein B
MDYPRLRPVEVFPVQADNQELVCLRDPSGLAETPLFLNKLQLFFVSRMNGSNSLRDIQADYCRATGEIIPKEQIESLAKQLNDLHYLDGPDFQGFLASLVEKFSRLPVRPARHAGSAYERDPQALRAQLDGYFIPPDGPGPLSQRESSPSLRGLIAPHIDFHRGGAAYAHAYKCLAEHGGADVFITFGTCHNFMQRRYALTLKDFETPLGAAEVDREFVNRLTAALKADYLEDEFAHRNEHSIEFQAVFLRYVFGGWKSFRIVPILVGSFQDIHGGGRMPAQDPEVQDMIGALKETMKELAGSYCLIAGADLAHVGRRFGDPSGPTENMLREVEREDRRFLALVESGDAEGASRSIAADHDRRRVCGYPPIYMTLSCLDNPGGRLLQYRQWADLQSGAAVTFGALAIF